jgi:Domain of unknown function (DUF4253)
VLRSWEDRFGARLLQVGLAEIRLLAGRPPRTIEAAHHVTAEHYAFCNECGTNDLRDIAGITANPLDSPIWIFWWDAVAPEIAGSTRTAISMPGLVAYAATTEVAPTAAAPISSSRRRPMRSPIVPLVTRKPTTGSPGGRILACIRLHSASWTRKVK